MQRPLPPNTKPASSRQPRQDIRPIYAAAMLALQDLPTTFPVRTSVPISSARLFIYRNEPTCFISIDNTHGSIHVVIEAFCQINDRVVILDVLTYLSDENSAEGSRRQQLDIDSFFRTDVEEMRNFVQHLSDPARLFDDICRSFQLVQQLLIETVNLGLNQDDDECHHA